MKSQTAMFILSLLAGATVSAEILTLKKDIHNRHFENTWLGVNAVAVVAGEILPVSSMRTGSGCQMTRQTSFGARIDLPAGTEIELGTAASFVSEKPICVAWEDNSSGDDVCVQYGESEFEAVYSRLLSHGAETFSIQCNIPAKVDHDDVKLLFKKSWAGIL